jgi:VWFA-related protein
MRLLRSMPGVLLLCAALLAQNATETPDATIRTTVDVVVAPVTVLDRDENYVDGLRPDQFHLFDNDKEQSISVDVSFLPISLVIAVEGSDRMESVLPQIQKIGVMITPQVIGDQGETAVLAFDSRIREMQDFTADTDKITQALKNIHPGSAQSRMIDGVDRAVRMLGTRPPNRRRIVLLISETRDKSSEGRVREALIDAQMANVSIYTVDVSRFVTSVMGKPEPPPPDNRPPAMVPLPSGVPATPNTVMQATGSNGSSAQFVPLMVEIFKDVKAIFVDNPSEVFTQGTGGEQFGFMKQRALEDAIMRIGAELHSQYLLSYRPNNKTESGFHQISIQITGRKDLRIRTRPGYWLGAR